MHIARPYFYIGIFIFVCFMNGLSFIAGYMVATKEFFDYCATEGLGDRVAASIYSLYGDTQAAENEEEEQAAEQSEAEESTSRAQPLMQEPEQVLVSSEDRIDKLTLYEAQLIGFGARRNAVRYAAKLKSFGVTVHIVERTSISSNSRKVLWYQVVTDPLPYHELLVLVAKLKKQDNLEGVVFVESTIKNSDTKNSELHIIKKEE